MAYTRFKADQDVTDALMHLRKKRRAGPGGSNCRRNSPGDVGGMCYADDAGVVSKSLKQLRKIMGVIVVVCAAFGLTVSEAKAEIMCLRTKAMPEFTAIFGVEAGG